MSDLHFDDLDCSLTPAASIRPDTPGSVLECNLRIYNKSTFLKLAERDKTPMAQAINAFRLGLVRRYCGDGKILDFGIGAGTFLKLHGNCVGYDINPYAVSILKKRGLFFDPYKGNLAESRIVGVTMFDSMEHLEAPHDLFNRIGRQTVFVTTPMFWTMKHMMGSRHFKPGEHAWHFMPGMFANLVDMMGFRIIEELNEETRIGREDIKTFVLKRKANADQKAENH